MSKNNKIKKEITKHEINILNGFRYALNHCPLKKRIVFAWRILRGKF